MLLFFCNDIIKLHDMIYCIAYTALALEVVCFFSPVLEAVDVCLKAIFVFILQYPAEAHSAWFFLQKAVFGFCQQSMTELVVR